MGKTSRYNLAEIILGVTDILGVNDIRKMPYDILNDFCRRVHLKETEIFVRFLVHKNKNEIKYVRSRKEGFDFARENPDFSRYMEIGYARQSDGIHYGRSLIHEYEKDFSIEENICEN